eukprot:Opistho-1_new@15219
MVFPELLHADVKGLLQQLVRDVRFAGVEQQLPRVVVERGDRRMLFSQLRLVQWNGFLVNVDGLFDLLRRLVHEREVAHALRYFEAVRAERLLAHGYHLLQHFLSRAVLLQRHEHVTDVLGDGGDGRVDLAHRLDPDLHRLLQVLEGLLLVAHCVQEEAVVAESRCDVRVLATKLLHSELKHLLVDRLGDFVLPHDLVQLRYCVEELAENRMLFIEALGEDLRRLLEQLPRGLVIALGRVPPRDRSERIRIHRVLLAELLRPNVPRALHHPQRFVKLVPLKRDVGQVLEHIGHVRMVPSQLVLVDVQRALKERRRVIDVLLQLVHPRTNLVAAVRHVGVVRPILLLANAEGSPLKVDRVLLVPARVLYGRERRACVGNVRMLVAQRRLERLEPPSLQGERGLQVAHREVEARELRDSRRRVFVVVAEQLLLQRQRLLQPVPMYSALI